MQNKKDMARNRPHNMKRAYVLYLGLIIFHFKSIQSAPLSSYLVSSFTPSDPDSNLPFNHIAINNITGDIYIGARERLYQLDSNLALKETVDTGKCYYPNRDYINDNKLLVVVITPQHYKLISCGGRGSDCQQKDLANISVDLGYLRNTEYVVATGDLPTVGVVAPGADYEWNGMGNLDESFYLFTGISGRGGHTEITFISKHSLSDLQSHQNIPGHVMRIQNENYFKHLTSYNDYIYYFISRSEKTYLGRICRSSSDENFESYTEIELQCGHNGSQNGNVIQSVYIGPAGSQLAESMNINTTDDLLYAVFSSSPSSSLCVYKMIDVQQGFEDAILGCILGKGTGTENSFISGSKCEKYPATNYTPPEWYPCRATFEDGYVLYSYVSATNPLSASPTTTIPNNVISTSIVTTIERHHTVAFVGNTEGSLHKINIVNTSFGYVYEDIFLGGGSVLQEMFLDELKEQLTLATSSDRHSTQNRVVTVDIVNCGQYQTCEECIGEDGGNDGDPYCGWCTLEARCTRYKECPSPDESTRWLSYNAIQCVSISDVQPDHRLPYQITQEITITVQQLPTLKDNHQYQCAFDSYLVNAVTTSDTVVCTIPPVDELPTIPVEDDHKNLTLSVFSTETTVYFISTDFILFDCTYHKSCSFCVSSAWPCDWCVYDNMCTHKSSSCQDGETVVIGENNPIGSGDKGQIYCPQLVGTSETFFIPVNIPSSFSLVTRNIPTDRTKIQSFDCILLIDGDETRVETTIVNESYVLCGAKEYMYDDDILQNNVSVSVQWNDQHYIDDPNDAYVTLYKCSANDGSCSRCLSPEATPSFLNCGWCGNDCNVIESDVCQNNRFVNQNETNLCSAPVITDFYPISGPINGNTRLEIIGTDLGVAFNDVLNVTIGDLACSLADMDSYYQPGQSVSCLTGLSHAVTSGHIAIKIWSGSETRTGNSIEKFHYRDPMISGFSPNEGQAAGGTRITITGMYLNTGRIIEARFGEAHCNDLTVRDMRATCITSSITINEETSLIFIMSFDGVERMFSEYSFTYKLNPVIIDIDRSEAIMSGGLNIEITGERFDLVQIPRIIVTSPTTSAFELCNGTDTLLICPSPKFPDDVASTVRKRAPDVITFVANLTFDFDGYIINGGLIEYYPDPIYESFGGPNRLYESSNGRLEITGFNLDLGSRKDDIQILLGPSSVCDVDYLKTDVVGCQLPEERPLAGDENGTRSEGTTRNLPAVTVLHGNLKFYPGFVSAWPTEGNPLIATVIPTVIVLLIFITIPTIILACWYRKKRLEVKRAKEEVAMVRMNILKRVREVSSTSLDMTDADNRVQSQGVRFVGNVQYVTLMMFAGLGVHPETSDPEYMEDFMEHSVIVLYRMLKKKEKMIEFVRQLETKKTGQGRERELIASLLAITFVSEWNSIVFTETESVTEKLISNWFSICMFEYLKVYGLYSLFMLYQAIKTQAEKGPIDAVTGVAYYTLEADKLIDEEIDFHSLNIDVVDEDGHTYVRVNVLNVDTVKQAKQKILDCLWMKGFCLLPRDVDAVDLVWIESPESYTLLQDVDDMSETQSKVMFNTMKSYGIRNGSRVALVGKNQLPKAPVNGYQALDVKELSSNTYESLIPVSDEMNLTSGPSQLTLNAVHLKIDAEGPTRKAVNLPDNIKRKRAELDRNLAIPHMLKMKASIGPYVDGVFEVMFKKPSRIPLPVKHLFDTFDDLAVKYTDGKSSKECAQNWKMNCLSRFWCQVLTNLQSLFDMPRSETADRCVIAVAEAIADAARTATLSQSESNHLPYYNEHPLQRQMMSDYCSLISSQPKVKSRLKLTRACSSITKEFKGHFSHLSNLLHLYNLTKDDVEGLLN
ncbi:plexin-A4-like isoform X3 [Lytechinus pictus]|uniref:plexin-A4-like isoform X3 n=1 Tax=Lytechinus pictus TaxID=7653 RepID=UPI0030B9F9B2